MATNQRSHNSFLSSNVLDELTEFKHKGLLMFASLLCNKGMIEGAGDCSDESIKIKGIADPAWMNE